MSEFESTVVYLLSTIAGVLLGLTLIVIYELAWRRR